MTLNCNFIACRMEQSWRTKFQLVASFPMSFLDTVGGNTGINYRYRHRLSKIMGVVVGRFGYSSFNCESQRSNEGHHFLPRFSDDTVCQLPQVNVTKSKGTSIVIET